ncbi:type II secretion system GspH family protein [bacterium]|nr:type II secretion system GspH family protein [bacterium]
MSFLKGFLKKKHFKTSKGFSLIEILIVLAIVSLTVALLSQRIGKNEGRKIRRDVRVFASQIRDLRNKARMRNSTYRLVINLPENGIEKQSYWVESTGKNFLVIYNEDELKKRKDALREGDKDPNGFNVDSEVSKEGPQPLPDGLLFKSVEIAAQKKEYTSGRIYIHFFPEGRVEEAVIHITDGQKLHWSLAIHPLTGRVDLINKEKKLKDFQ